MHAEEDEGQPGPSSVGAEVGSRKSARDDTDQIIELTEDAIRIAAKAKRRVSRNAKSTPSRIGEKLRHNKSIRRQH